MIEKIAASEEDSQSAVLEAAYRKRLELKKAFENIAGREPTYDEYLHEDIVNIENECTDIFLANGWANSYGCMAEVDTSIKQNLKFHYENKIIVG